ncbi:hypothetical protein [Psychrobacter sp. I-STPA6b]|uniref:hypothetical protein n=1 Tax=Psychrobacter sp. I-STPA6b TaxID=2585718 RepID=UPI001D0C78BE|nr:hypothetical protein [Psychrobacter sp. I-STPA6b]
MKVKRWLGSYTVTDYAINHSDNLSLIAIVAGFVYEDNTSFISILPTGIMNERFRYNIQSNLLEVELDYLCLHNILSVVLLINYNLVNIFTNPIINQIKNYEFYYEYRGKIIFLQFQFDDFFRIEEFFEEDISGTSSEKYNCLIIQRDVSKYIVESLMQIISKLSIKLSQDKKNPWVEFISD